MTSTDVRLVRVSTRTRRNVPYLSPRAEVDWRPGERRPRRKTPAWLALSPASKAPCFLYSRPTSHGRDLRALLVLSGSGPSRATDFGRSCTCDLTNTVLPPSGRSQRGRRRSSSSLRPLERAALLVARAVLEFPQHVALPRLFSPCPTRGAGRRP